MATPTVLRPLRRLLRMRGHDTHLAYELRSGVTGDVRFHAEQLERTVERVRQLTGVERVRVVGTSQGGLVALWWAHQNGWRHVDRLVALGTPFRGAPLARRVRWLGALSTGLQQVQPDGDFLTALEALPLLRPVTAISMERDPVCPPAVCALPGMRHVSLPGGFGPVAHQTMMLRPRVADAIHDALVC